MAASKKPNIVNFVKINGEFVNMDSLPESEKKKIGKELAIRFARGFGYEPVNEAGKEKEVV